MRELLFTTECLIMPNWKGLGQKLQSPVSIMRLESITEGTNMFLSFQKWGHKSIALTVQMLEPIHRGVKTIKPVTLALETTPLVSLASVSQFFYAFS